MFTPNALDKASLRAWYLARPLSKAMLEARRTLNDNPRSLSTLLLYQGMGAHFYEQMTALPGYHIRRLETELLNAHAAEIADIVGHCAAFLDYGGSTDEKAMALLRAIGPTDYVIVDAAQEALEKRVNELQGNSFKATGLLADFTKPITLSPSIEGPAFGLFAGSTFGNFSPELTRQCFANMAATLGRGGYLLVGVDSATDHDRLRGAYLDPQGRSARFVKHVLELINIEGGADFDLDAFHYEVGFPPVADLGMSARVELSLVSDRAQTVHFRDVKIDFGENDRIKVAHSDKYTDTAFKQLVDEAGWKSVDKWKDEDGLYTLHLLRC